MLSYNSILNSLLRSIAGEEGGKGCMGNAMLNAKRLLDHQAEEESQKFYAGIKLLMNVISSNNDVLHTL